MLLVQCQRRPSDVISRDKMKEVTKDMVLAQSYIDNQYSMPDSVKEAYFRSVLERHGLTEAQYDTSLAWYGGNLPMLTKIYEQIIEELKSEAILLDTLYQDSIRKAGLKYEPLQSLWEGPSRLLVDRATHHYFISKDLYAGSLVESDTLDLSMTLLPALMQDERMSVRFLTLSGDSCIVRSEEAQWDRSGGSKVRLSYVIPADTSAGQTNWHRILVTITKSGRGDRLIPLLIDSLYLVKRESHPSSRSLLSPQRRQRRPQKRSLRLREKNYN